MRGKNIYHTLLSLLVLLTITTVGIAQKKDKKKKKKINVERQIMLGDLYFEQENYFLACKEYELAAEGDSTNGYSRYKLGESYRMSLEYEMAEKWYKEANRVAHDEYPLAAFWYATMQKLNGNYVGAKESYENFLNSFKPVTEEEKFLVDRALFEYNGSVLALDEFKKPTRDYHFENVGPQINTEYSEYAPVIGANDSSIVFTSSREGSKGGERYERMGDFFSDNYRFEKVDGEWKQVPNTDDFDVVNTIRNDGAGVFSSNKKKYYYTSCSELYDDGEYETHPCAIYVTKLVDDKWIKPVKLNKNINAPGIETRQPSLSSTGDTMFFTAINRPGGYGMHDIWYSVARGEERWAEAENLGPGVNTPFIEVSPCYHAESNMLFFASNGHEGFGGLDIFKVEMDFKIAENIGLPFNSNRDDFYFVLGEEKGYLSSNRDGGNGHDDIYWFDLKSHRSLVAILNKDSIDAKSLSIEGKVLLADTKEPAADVSIILADKDGIAIKVTSTDDNGTFRFENLDALEDYLLLLKDKDPRLTAKVQYIIDNLRLKPSELAVSKTWFENIYFDFDQSYIRPEAAKVLDELVEYLKDNPEVQVEVNANTDNFGSDGYNNILSQKRGNRAVAYLKENGVKNSSIVINALGEGTPIATNTNPIGRQLNRRVEFFIVGGNAQSTAMTYIIEPKKTLFSIAKEFNMTVDELRELNGIEGENIKAFRPIRVRRIGDEDIIAPRTLSTSKFNKYAYLNNEVGSYDSNKGGITTSDSNGDFDILIGEGETKNEEGNNNFQITLHEEEYYIVKPLNTLFSIAKKYGMTVQELKDLNHISDTENLQVGQKLKVKKK